MVLVMATETLDSAKQLHDELLPKMPAGSHDHAGCPFCSGASPEIAQAGGAGMAGESTSTAVDLNAPEIVAVVNDRVERETAELRTRAESAERARDEAQTKIDVLEAEKAAAVQEKEAAQAELASVKTEVEAERASASNRDSRKAALREVAAHLSDAWFDQEVAAGDGKVARLDKIARMTEDEFASYKGEIASAFEGVTVAPAAGGNTTGQPPRETAMAGSASAGNGSQGGSAPKASSRFLSGVRAY